MLSRNSIGIPVLAALAVAAWVVGGCGRYAPVADSTGAERDSARFGVMHHPFEYARHLQAKAGKLAEAEISRLSAAEMIYRNEAKLYTTHVPITMELTGGWTKLYREYTNYDVFDVYRSESLIYPVTIELRFEYDLVGTPYRSIHGSESMKQAQTDTDYSVVRSGTLIRRYRCDALGDYVGKIPDLPPRPHYFEDQDPTAAQGAGSNPYPPGDL